ncbi:MAG TPA: nitroreductase family protein [Microthrixaceae bacterium]|nr:nitroreductase family protein [Microthrixaceae bacterium]
MDLAEALAARRSCRSYRSDPIDDELLDRVLSASLRGPSAGNSASLEWLVLNGPDEVGRYWDVTLPVSRRDRFPWPGLLRAPVLAIPAVRPEAYLERYSESDKRHSGLGDDVAAWTVPYWWVDGGAGVMAMLLAATAEGLGSLLFGQFRHEAAVAQKFGVPAHYRLLGTVALGWPDGGDRSSRSARRGRRELSSVTHRGVW